MEDTFPHPQGSTNMSLEGSTAGYSLAERVTCVIHATTGWSGMKSASLHCNENPIYVFLFWELVGLSPSFHIHVSVIDLYIPRIDPHVFLQQNRQIHRGNIYIPLSNTLMWKFGLWPHNSFSGNMCFKFSRIGSLQCGYFGLGNRKDEFTLDIAT
jgi:hypothetical protein